MLTPDTNNPWGDEDVSFGTTETAVVEPVAEPVTEQTYAEELAELRAEVLSEVKFQASQGTGVDGSEMVDVDNMSAEDLKIFKAELDLRKGGVTPIESSAVDAARENVIGDDPSLTVSADELMNKPSGMSSEEYAEQQAIEEQRDLEKAALDEGQEQMSGIGEIFTSLAPMIAALGGDGVMSAFTGLFSPEQDREITAEGTTLTSNITGGIEGDLREPVAPLAIAQTQEQGRGASLA